MGELGSGRLTRFGSALTANSQLTGPGMGAATETAHSALSLGIGTLNTARTVITFGATRVCDDALADQKWRIRSYFGAAGLGGILLADSQDFLNVKGDMYRIDGEIQILAAGAGGKIDAFYRLWNESTEAVIYGSAVGEAVALDAENDLTISGWSSSADAKQQMTLRNFWYDVRRP